MDKNESEKQKIAEEFTSFLKLEDLVKEKKPVSKVGLMRIVEAHVQTVPYQSYSHAMRNTIKDMMVLDWQHLKEVIIDKRMGGMCYMISEFANIGLRSLGYDAHACRSRVLLGKPYDATLPYTHDILFVFLDGKQYLVDVGFGYNSLREPFEFDPSKEVQTYNIQDIETYQIRRFPEEGGNFYYILYMMIKDEWTTFYMFHNECMKDNEPQEEYRDFLKAGNSYLINNVFKGGILVNKGRICFQYMDKTFTRNEFHNGKKTVGIVYDDPNKFVSDVQAICNIKIDLSILP